MSLAAARVEACTVEQLVAPTRDHCLSRDSAIFTYHRTFDFNDNANDCRLNPNRWERQEEGTHRLSEAVSVLWWNRRYRDRPCLSTRWKLHNYPVIAFSSLFRITWSNYMWQICGFPGIFAVLCDFLSRSWNCKYGTRSLSLRNETLFRWIFTVSTLSKIVTRGSTIASICLCKARLMSILDQNLFSSNK